MAIYVFLHDTYADWEVGYLLPELARNQKDVVTFGLSSGPLRSLGGLRVIPDIAFASINRASVDALILPGGMHWRTFADEGLASFVKEVISRGKPIAAICGATGFLAQIGVLDRVRHTSNSLEFLKEKAPSYDGASLYQKELAVSDRGVITASGLGSVDFTYELLKVLGVYTSKGCETWFRAFKFGEEPTEAPETPQRSKMDFDESLLEDNLKKTVEQRIAAHDSALEVAHEFQRAGQELYHGQNVIGSSSTGKDVIR
jgi:putative intracellular protease/amidase